ncbi:PREDICTED: wall-associated receptor kinase [Prunus dulcis]|uniref:PREDICTED: wall-associated receptor kinase n=1 Tax=Prunus dulcis TaxID=3755 RepID=A0A5E4FMS8_PRUDU|nr:PREDICTED: wall-associated receptor kinase [Prunus dulcis]
MDKFMFTTILHTVTLLLLSCSAQSVTATLRCGNCGTTPVPYPLSTGPGCGQTWYRIRCTAGTLWLDALNNSSYAITSINQETQWITIRPASFAPNTCLSSDFHSQGIQLDPNLPFNITGSNTVLLLICTDAMLNLQAPINCSSNSLCHSFIRDNAVACTRETLCCTFRTGGSQTAYIIRDNADCKDLLNLKCLVDPSSVGGKGGASAMVGSNGTSSMVFVKSSSGMAMVVGGVVGIMGIVWIFFTTKEIARATNYFSKDNLIGSGGFGEVFKGTFDDGIITAIKRAKPGNTKGIDQILNEVRILCQVNHRSLVRLLGCCVELDQQPVLIYELVESTDTSKNTHIFTSAQGTLGYLDPEYYINFQLTDKIDVYSFGVVLLELLTSMKVIDFNRGEEDVNLVVYMKRVMKEKRLMDVVDPVIKEGASKLDLGTMKALGFLAASCLDEQRQTGLR